MKNLKIKVNTPDESEEAQKLFFMMGLSWLSGSREVMSLNSPYLYTEDDRFYCGDYHSTFNESGRKEVTLSDLRDMVAQKREQPDAASPNEIAKKEYLLPTDQGYELCLCEEGMTIHASWIEVPEGAEVAVLFEPAMVSNRSGELFFWKDNGDTHYVYSERSAVLQPTGWYSCKDNQLTTLDEFLRSWKGDCRVVWRREQSAASPNDIAKTAEVHREHNLFNELNDLCAEFGCPPGMDRFAWLKDQLDISQGRVTLGPLATNARMQQESMELRLALLKDLFQPQPVTYHYAASINTARGTVAYDGVITMPQRITGMEDYLQARAEIAKDGNVAPEQVNIHSLSIIS